MYKLDYNLSKTDRFFLQGIYQKFIVGDNEEKERKEEGAKQR